MTQPLPSIPYTLLQAIARAEGFYDITIKPNRPQRNNNPLDLEWHSWMASFGSTQADPRFAIFPSVDLGFQAGRHLFSFPLYKDKTISQALSLFAPGSENNLKQYMLNICSFTEQSPDTIITPEILG